MSDIHIQRDIYEGTNILLEHWHLFTTFFQVIRFISHVVILSQVLMLEVHKFYLYSYHELIPLTPSLYKWLRDPAYWDCNDYLTMCQRGPTRSSDPITVSSFEWWNLICHIISKWCLFTPDWFTLGQYYWQMIISFNTNQW